MKNSTIKELEFELDHLLKDEKTNKFREDMRKFTISEDAYLREFYNLNGINKKTKTKKNFLTQLVYMLKTYGK